MASSHPYGHEMLGKSWEYPTVGMRKGVLEKNPTIRTRLWRKLAKTFWDLDTTFNKYYDLCPMAMSLIIFKDSDYSRACYSFHALPLTPTNSPIQDRLRSPPLSEGTAAIYAFARGHESVGGSSSF